MTDVLKRAAPFLQQCGLCDAGLSMNCTCPQGDYRSVMLDLVRELKEARPVVEAAQAYVNFPDRPSDPAEGEEWDLECSSLYFALREAVTKESND